MPPPAPPQAYWPFHKPHCRRNEFADAMEEQDPRFAAWMRRHGKQAVLKDDEVDRLERAGAAASGEYTRQDMLESMYGRAEPKPAAPSYSAEERAAMRRAADAERAAERLALQQARASRRLRDGSAAAPTLCPYFLGTAGAAVRRD